MRALIKNSAVPEDVTLGEVGEPEPAPGQVRVRTQACGLCGSDVHAWRHDRGYEWIAPPVVLGHEAVGRVVALGDGVDDRWLGKRVVPVSIDGCGTCDLCERGLRQICPQRSVLGLSFDGAAAESFVVPEVRLVEIDEHLPAPIAALTEPLSVACRSVAHVEGAVDGPAKVVVSGPGPIGTMAALVLAQRGHDVVLTGIGNDEASRLPLARSLGLRTVVAGKDTMPFIPTGWVEASGSTHALDAAIAAVLPGSPVAVVGLFAHDRSDRPQRVDPQRDPDAGQLRIHQAGLPGCRAGPGRRPRTVAPPGHRGGPGRRPTGPRAGRGRPRHESRSHSLTVTTP